MGWVPQAGPLPAHPVSSETRTYPSPVTQSDSEGAAESPSLPPQPQLANRHVYSGSADRTVKCWLADTGERVRTFAAHGHSVSALKYHAGTCK